MVDGQQRLTSLYLLLNCLGLNVKNTLTFACREKSNYTLQNIQELLHENRSKLDMDRIEQGIQRGIKILTQELNKEDFDKELFLKKLSKVVVYRIQVPDNTDLNRYFEIMNTRGAQLEQHDILKATLMSYLPDAEKTIFAKIWDACSDMTGYVQMHFVSKNNELRESIFGGSWNNLPSNLWKDYLSMGKSGSLSLLMIGGIKSLLMNRINTEMNVSVQAATMARVLSLPADFFKNYSSGEITSRAQYIGSLCQTLVQTFLSTGLTSIFSLVYITQIFVYAKELVIPALCITLVTLVFSIVSSLAQMKISKKQMELSGKMSGMTYQIITGVQKIKLSGSEKRMFARWMNEYAEEAKYTYGIY